VNGISDLLYELQLFLLQGVLLCEALPVGVVRSNVLHFKFDVIPPQSHRVEGLEIEPISHYQSSLLQAQVHHALQGFNTCHPLYLLGVEDPLPPFSKRLHDEEIPLPPPGYQLVLGAQLHPRPLEDLSWR